MSPVSLCCFCVDHHNVLFFFFAGSREDQRKGFSHSEQTCGSDWERGADLTWRESGGGGEEEMDVEDVDHEGRTGWAKKNIAGQKTRLKGTSSVVSAL